MKKYSWIMALLLALTLAFIGCPEGGGDDPDKPGPNIPEPPPGGADPIDVEITQDMLDVWGKGEIKAEEDGNGFTFTYGSGADTSHGNAVAMFKIDLKEAAVRDYEKVTFTFTGISGDLGENTGQYDKGTEKGVNLLAAADKNDMKSFGGNDGDLVKYIVNAYPLPAASGAGINAAGAKIGTDQPATKELELAIAPLSPQAKNTGEVWFSFYLHASSVKFEGSTATTEPTSFKITDVKFVPRESLVVDKVTIDEILGVDAPVKEATGATAITETTQYTGDVAWTPALVDGKFGYDTEYKATITLEAKKGFTFADLAEDFTFKVAGATDVTYVVGTPATTCVVTATFSKTAAENEDTVVNATAISGVIPPVGGVAPVTTAPTTALTPTQWTASAITWTPAVTGTFDYEETYTATFTLTAATGFTFAGFTGTFTVAGATVTYAPDSGTITAVFPPTGSELPSFNITVGSTAQKVNIFGAGTGTVVESLAAPAQGYRLTYGTGQYGAVYAYFEVDFGTGKKVADYAKLTLKWKGVAGDIGWKTFGVWVSETEFTGSITEPGRAGSQYFGAANTTESSAEIYLNAPSVTTQKAYIALNIWAAHRDGDTSYDIYDIAFDSYTPQAVTITAVPGVVAPVAGVVPIEVVTATAQFTGSVRWSPDVEEFFDVSTEYTATITLAAIPPYTFDGVEADSFTLTGITDATVTNPANSGVITAVFPETEAIAVEPITTFEIAGVGTIEIESLIFDAQYFAVEGIEDGIEINGGNWDWALVKIPITLTGGKTAGDIVSVKFDLEGVTGGATTYKDYYLFVGKPIAGGQISTANAANTVKFETGDVANGTPVPVTITIDNLAAGLASETVFEIAIWANMQNTKYTFTNFEFTFE